MMQVIDRCSQVKEPSMRVCNTENENCMFGVCASCPGAETLKVLLQNELDDITVEYKQWVVTDRATHRSLMNSKILCIRYLN
jgi:hypothetical protein